MSEQDIKQLLYKDLQRYKLLSEKINLLEGQVLRMHEFLQATAKQVTIIGDALVKLANAEKTEEV